MFLSHFSSTFSPVPSVSLLDLDKNLVSQTSQLFHLSPALFKTFGCPVKWLCQSVLLSFSMFIWWEEKGKLISAQHGFTCSMKRSICSISPMIQTESALLWWTGVHLQIRVFLFVCFVLCVFLSQKEKYVVSFCHVNCS